MNRRAFLGSALAACTEIAFAQSPGTQAEFYTPPPSFKGDWRLSVDPHLPNVLLIGDSISISYTLPVRRLMAGKANIYRPMHIIDKSPANCGDTRRGLQEIHSWINGHSWSVIHFNWGLHDLCYRNPASKLYGNRDKLHGTLQVPLPDYKRNLTQLVHVLQGTHASLVWASTTVVPPNEAGRFVGDEVKYNAAAAEIMHSEHIPDDDLYALTSKFPPNNFYHSGDVHYSRIGIQLLAQQVASSVLSALG